MNHCPNLKPVNHDCHYPGNLLILSVILLGALTILLASSLLYGQSSPAASSTSSQSLKSAKSTESAKSVEAIQTPETEVSHLSAAENKPEQRPKNLRFINDISLLLYFHHNQGVEITGNESTFTAAFNLAFASIRRISPAWHIGFKSDLYVIENLSLKGRLFNNFNPPPFLLKEFLIDIIYQSPTFPLETSLTLGVFRPLAKTFPMRNYHLPIIFRTSPYNPTKGALDPLDTAKASAEDLRIREVGHAFITGYRDDPLGVVILNNFDTGLLYSLYVHGFELGFSISNGEEGLDPNSAKALSFRTAFSNTNIHTGFNGQIGNIGSVPIKETKHFYQYFFYYTSTHFNCNLYDTRTYYTNCPPEKNWSRSSSTAEFNPRARKKPAPLQFQLGFETMLHLHGIRELDIINSDGTLNTNYTWLGNPVGKSLGQFFDYIDGYFSPFAVFNDGSYDASAQINPETLYGLSFLIFSELRYKDFLSFVVHFSGYDPNLLSEGNELYTRRYRVFSRLGFHVKNFLSFYISGAYTYDALHLNWAQFFEREPRSIHFISDYTFYLGIVYYIGR